MKLGTEFPIKVRKRMVQSSALFRYAATAMPSGREMRRVSSIALAAMASV